MTLSNRATLFHETGLDFQLLNELMMMGNGDAKGLALLNFEMAAGSNKSSRM